MSLLCSPIAKATTVLTGNSLHCNLIEHLNAEVSLGTITDMYTAKQWLAGTFLCVRLKENPEHYKIEGDVPRQTLDERLEQICERNLELLQTAQLVTQHPALQSTEFGDAMARYHVQYSTMKAFLDIPTAARTSEILSAIGNASEFHEIRFRSGEKAIYRNLNKNLAIKFTVPDTIDRPAHKVLLIIQSVLGASI